MTRSVLSLAGLRAALLAFWRRRDGAASVFGIYLFLATAMIGGLAVDGMNISRTRAILQVAADSAAHAAMHYRSDHDEGAAKQIALQIGRASVPHERYGDALTLADIEFGVWAEDTMSFSPSDGDGSAVRVTVRLAASRGNALNTFLLRLAGQDSFDLVATAVFVGEVDGCQTQGFAARERVDIRSNNTFVRDFCIHSNDYVEVNNGNYFEDGVIVSMPDINDLWMPGSGFSNNPGLQQALRNDVLDFSVIDNLPAIIDQLDTPGSSYAPGYLNSGAIVHLDTKKLKKNDFRVGRIHHLMCNGSGGKVTIPTNTTIENAVVISNCEIKFAKNVLLRNAILATTSTSARSFNGSSGVSVGFNDSCAAGGGAKLITLGGMKFPSKLQIYGGQLIAAGDIVFAAQANGVHGASLIAGGEISGTSNMVFGNCETRVDDPFGAVVARLVD